MFYGRSRRFAPLFIESNKNGQTSSEMFLGRSKEIALPFTDSTKNGQTNSDMFHEMLPYSLGDIQKLC